MVTARGLPPDLADRLDPTDAPLPDPRELRHAAVVAILMPPITGDGDDEEPRLVLIERSGTLRSHAGQLAFPGGKPEVEDADLVATALREAEEEVGLPRGEARVLGRLGAVPTPTGFLIVPFVAWAPASWRPEPTSPEVHAILTPSIGRLLDPAIHRITGRGVWQGYHYEMHEFAIHQPPLWGATARMTWDLLERVRGNGPL
jgi:8-oxo-dGTP pyrophosphatase MutT (NUDIX family)